MFTLFGANAIYFGFSLFYEYAPKTLFALTTAGTVILFVGTSLSKLMDFDIYKSIKSDLRWRHNNSLLEYALSKEFWFAEIKICGITFFVISGLYFLFKYIPLEFIGMFVVITALAFLGYLGYLNHIQQCKQNYRNLTGKDWNE